MKACPEKALLLQQEEVVEEDEEEEEDGAFEGLKQEEEVEEENGAAAAAAAAACRPFVVVKLEEEQAACSARFSGSTSAAAAEAKMELELSLFAPVESEGDDEDEQQRLQQRPLTDSESDSAGASAWRNRGARERGQTEGGEFPQRRPRGRPRRPKKALARRGRPRKTAAGGESRDRNESSASVEQPCVPVRSGSTHGVAHAVPGLTGTVSPPAGWEPPLLPTDPGRQEGAQGGVREENVLLEVLSHCRFLHAAVQRLEQKIDQLQWNQSPSGGCRRREIPEEVGRPAGQLSRSLAQRLGPSPQPRRRWDPTWKRNQAQAGSSAPEPAPAGRTRGAGRGNSRRGGRWRAKRGPQPEQELMKDESRAVREKPQAAEASKVPQRPRKAKHLNKTRTCSRAVGKPADPVVIQQEDTSPTEEDKQVWLAEMYPQYDLTGRGSVPGSYRQSL